MYGGVAYTPCTTIHRKYDTSKHPLTSFYTGVLPVLAVIEGLGTRTLYTLASYIGPICCSMRMRLSIPKDNPVCLLKRSTVAYSLMLYTPCSLG